MKILMVTNVYTPQIGGVTRSVQQFSQEFQKCGHDVLIIAPEYERMPAGETNVIRVPAIPRFYQKQYPLPLPVMSALIPEVRDFSPDIVHSHHPFLLGTTAQVIAADREVPLVYTHHTRYSVYIETKTRWPRAVEEGIVELITGYCALCHGIVAPSEDITRMLMNRGVNRPIMVIPTGVDVERYAAGDRHALRKELHLPSDAFVIGHVGRLGKEKNCDFLAQAVSSFLHDHPHAVFVVVGDGPEKDNLIDHFRQMRLSDRVHFLGFREGNELVNAYHSFDVFAFASHSETQGMVIAEAMAAGVPVVAVDGTGVREMVVDQKNGRLIPTDDQTEFCRALSWIAESAPQQRQALSAAARQTAQRLSQKSCAQRMLDYYQNLIDRHHSQPIDNWEHLQQKWDAGWQRWRNRARAVATMAKESLTLPESTAWEGNHSSRDNSV